LPKKHAVSMKSSAFIETAQMLIGGTDPLRMIAAAQYPIG
jgi:hypothetical protein